MKSLEIGVFLSSLHMPDQFAAMATAKGMGINLIQLGPEAARFFNKTDQLAAGIKKTGVEVSAVCIAFEGEDYADIPTVKRTVGFLNPETLRERIKGAKKFIDMAAKLKVGIVTAHVGFVPEDTGCVEYKRMLDTVEQLADYAGAKKVIFSMETGQEKAAPMREFIEATKNPNVKVNFDPANMILYGSGDPKEAVLILGKYLVHTHAKDGLWPKESGKLGTEVPLGEGQVGFEKYMANLKSTGYKGPLIIEREAGDQRIADIKKAKALLERLR
jgi:sugar phosphate isomerase/epimerase